MRRFRCRRRVPLQLLVLLTITGGSLAGCSGTPFGDQLAGSFSAPPPAAAPSRPASGSPARTETRPPRVVPPASPASPTSPASPAPSPAARPAPRAPVPASAPAPYRVTIRLPAADPAAPAERVTEVLRAAGVPFEVETIERIGVTAGAAAPRSTPAPPPP